jgi:hypothetical protein
MSMRAFALLLGVIVVGVLAGSGLAGLAATPPNDACLIVSDVPEGSTYGGSLELWPLGLRCDRDFAGRPPTPSVFFGPTLAELYAWIAAATLLAAFALRRRESAFARGAIAEALVLALLGAAWQLAGVQFALMAVVLLATPLAFVIEHRLRPVRARSWNTSLQLALALAAVGFCAIYGVLALPIPAIAIAVLAGGVISTRFARPDRTSTFST